MTNKELEIYLGYSPGPEQKAEILKHMESTGKTFYEAVADFSMCPMALRKCDGTFRVDGEVYTIESFRERWPGRKIVIISGPCPETTINK